MIIVNAIKRINNAYNIVDSSDVWFAYVNDCAMSRDGSTIAIASTDGIYLFSLSDDGLESLPYVDIYQDATEGCSLSNDGKFLATVDSWAHLPLLTYVKSGDKYISLPDPNVVPESSGRSCALSGDGMVLAVAYESGILIYSFDGTRYIEATNIDYTPPNGSILKCALSESGKDLVLFLSSHPFVVSYALKGNTYKRLPDPDILPTSPCTGGISGDGTTITCVQSNNPKLLTYEKRLL